MPKIIFEPGDRIIMKAVPDEEISQEKGTIVTYDPGSDTYVVEGDEEGICEVPSGQVERLKDEDA